MNRIAQIRLLNQMLLDEMPAYRAQAAAFPMEIDAQRKLLRSLMNVRPPWPLRADFLKVQDALLSAERAQRGVIWADALPSVAAHPKIALWQGDITQLGADAIVNAANSALLGCFCLCHGCIDNAIHSAAGLQLRDECHQLMQEQGHEEPVGQAKLTRGYHLPARYVLHTVGPMITNRVTAHECQQLADCYSSCLQLAAENGLKTIAFCCISTGEFHFPSRQAAEIAVKTVTDFLKQDSAIQRVIFNVFKDTDREIYRALLGAD